MILDLKNLAGSDSGLGCSTCNSATGNHERYNAIISLRLEVYVKLLYLCSGDGFWVKSTKEIPGIGSLPNYTITVYMYYPR